MHLPPTGVCRAQATVAVTGTILTEVKIEGHSTRLQQSQFDTQLKRLRPQPKMSPKNASWAAHESTHPGAQICAEHFSTHPSIFSKFACSNEVHSPDINLMQITIPFPFQYEAPQRPPPCSCIYASTFCAISSTSASEYDAYDSRRHTDSWLTSS